VAMSAVVNANEPATTTARASEARVARGAPPSGVAASLATDGETAAPEKLRDECRVLQVMCVYAHNVTRREILRC
jgi:hypothetical protein